MILTIDVGNSRIKWAFWQGDKIIERGAVAYLKNCPFESLEKIYSTSDMFAATVSRVLAVCVAEDDVSDALNDWSMQHWGVSVEYLKLKLNIIILFMPMKILTSMVRIVGHAWSQRISLSLALRFAL